MTHVQSAFIIGVPEKNPAKFFVSLEVAIDLIDIYSHYRYNERMDIILTLFALSSSSWALEPSRPITENALVYKYKVYEETDPHKDMYSPDWIYKNDQKETKN